MKAGLRAGAAALMALASPAAAQDATARAILKELVEINTVQGEGSCTRAAQAVARRLASAGYAPGDLLEFAPAEQPAEGGLVATLTGTDPSAKPLLLLGHLDTVPARREDWARDPFQLGEENGYLIGRGVQDMKALIAIWTDAMIRLRTVPRPRKTVRLVLTCGEEGRGVNGLGWLIRNRPELLKAELALNEGGGGRLNGSGAPESLALQVLEKSYADFELEATNPGGHSSVPRPDNAIVSLARAIGQIADHPFPIQLTDTARAFFAASAATAPPQAAAAMQRVSRRPDDAAAIAILARDPQYNATMRTTCVTTRVAGGHANNALPQRATGIVNCRILPGQTVAAVNATLQRLAGPDVQVRPVEGGTQEAMLQPVPDALLRVARDVAAEVFPGIPVIPTMAVAASDAPQLIATGVPTYGVPGIMTDPDGGNMHGRNERLRVSAFLAGRRYLNRLLDRLLELR